MSDKALELLEPILGDSLSLYVSVIEQSSFAVDAINDAADSAIGTIITDNGGSYYDPVYKVLAIDSSLVATNPANLTATQAIQFALELGHEALHPTLPGGLVNFSIVTTLQEAGNAEINAEVAVVVGESKIAAQLNENMKNIGEIFKQDLSNYNAFSSNQYSGNDAIRAVKPYVAGYNIDDPEYNLRAVQGATSYLNQNNSYMTPPESIQDISFRQKGEIQFASTKLGLGNMTDFAKLDLSTTKISQAMDGSVSMTSPGYPRIGMEPIDVNLGWNQTDGVYTLQEGSSFLPEIPTANDSVESESELVSQIFPEGLTAPALTPEQALAADDALVASSHAFFKALFLASTLYTIQVATDQYNKGDYTGAEKTVEDYLSSLTESAVGGAAGQLVVWIVGALLFCEFGAPVGALAAIGTLAGFLGAVALPQFDSKISKLITDEYNSITGSHIDYIDHSSGNGSLMHASLMILQAKMAGDPLVIDLSGEGLMLSSLSRSSPYFDLTQTGFAHQTAWIGGETGFLVSMNPSGGIQLFTGGPGSGDGFAQLAQMDANHDGVVDSNDPGFANLFVWEDTNGNGQVDPGELTSLSALGIQSLSLAYSASSQVINGNEVTGIGSVTMTDGTTRELADVELQTSATYTQADQTPVIPDSILALPQLHGYGTLIDLQSQMTSDPVLVGLVQEFQQLAAGSVSLDDLRAATDSVLFQWAGVANVDPTSRGDDIDARRLDVIEQMLGQPLEFTGNYGDASNPGLLPSLLTNNAYLELENGALARLLVQSSPTLSAEFTFQEGADVIVSSSSFTQSLIDLQANIGALTPDTLSAWDQAAVVLDAIGVDSNMDVGSYSEIVSAQGIPFLGVLIDAVSQGLSTDVDSTGALTISNSPDDGMLTQGYGRPAGLTFVYAPGDGAVTIDFSELSWLLTYQGQVGNTLLLNGDVGDFTSTIESNGDEVITDGIDGDQLTLEGEYTTGDGYQHGVQTIQFDDGNNWTQSGDGEVLSLQTGYGQVTAAPAGNEEEVQVGAGIDETDVTLRSDSAGDLVMTANSGADSMVVSGNYTQGSAATHVGSIVFDDGTTWDMDGAYVLGRGEGQLSFATDGEAGSLRISPDIADTDVILQSDSAGDLTVSLQDDPQDSVTFTNDLYGYFGSIYSQISRIDFADGATLSLDGSLKFTWVGTVDQTTFTGSGWGSNTFQFGPGGDTVNAGNGSHGGSADNTFLFGEGDGNATINMDGGTGTIDIAPGIDASDILLQSDTAGDLTITFRGDSADSLTINGDLYPYYGVHSLVGSIVAGDGTVISLEQPLTFTWQADATHTSLVGSGWGDNLFYLAPGGDTVSVGTGAQGGSIDNSYVFNKGDGNVTVNVYGGWATLILGPDFTPADVQLQSTSDGTLVIRFADDDEDSITIPRDLFQTWWGAGSNNKAIQFSDGSTMDIGYPTPGVGAPIHFTWQADATHTTFTGSGYGDNDFILAPGGDTVLSGGTGANGGSIENFYDYHLGDGQVSLNSLGSWGTIRFGEGITASDVLLQTDDSGELTIALRNDPGDVITVSNDLWQAWWGVGSGTKALQFSDGSTMDIGHPAAGQGADLVFEWTGDAAHPTMVGSGYGSNIFDYGPGGQTAIGGQGNHGGSNYNTYNFAQGDGDATADVYNTSGVVDFKGVSASDIYLQADEAGDLTIALKGDRSDSLTLDGDLYGSFGAIHSYLSAVNFDDGSSLNLQAPLTFDLFGTDVPGTLTGSSWGTDVFTPGTAPVTIVPGTGAHGGGGDNQFVLAPGDGASSIDMTGVTGEIEVAAGFNASDVSITLVGVALTPDMTPQEQNQALAASQVVISLDGDPGSQITLSHDLTPTYANVSSAVDNINFADGSQLNVYGQVTQTLTGTSTNTVLQGADTENNIFAMGPGGDQVVAGQGELTPITGLMIAGGPVGNVFLYSQADGQAHVALGNGYGELKLSDLNAADISFAASGNQLSMSVLGNTQAGLVFSDNGGDWISSNASLTSVQFADGHSSSIAALLPPPPHVQP